MSNGIIELVERILVSNGYQNQYATFDEFYDNQIANSFILTDGPIDPVIDINTPELIAARRKTVKDYLEQKYWTKK
jgi:hypothetical protein